MSLLLYHCCFPRLSAVVATACPSPGGATGDMAVAAPAPAEAGPAGPRACAGCRRCSRPAHGAWDLGRGGSRTRFGWAAVRVQFKCSPVYYVMVIWHMMLAEAKTRFQKHA
ncbi:hypothetical protein SEVIR_9G151801v4 [Setaria viridis]|uniref:Secreted protein n=1 Tax=Setaria viridis TaxID=4556 RepID=A0A4U6SXT4_SETVI|nr:hypothetical protein SEVIR_9G151801v2 [Setaria viridis]